MNGLNGVADRVEKGDDVNRMVKTLLQARQQEKNFIMRGDESYLKENADKIQELLEQASATKEKFKQKTNRDQMDAVTASVNEYKTAFHEYGTLTTKKQETMELMRTRAREALEQAEAIRTDQKKQLAEARAKGGNTAEDIAFMNDKMVKADDANRMIKWFLDARKNEKEYIISGGLEKWSDTVQERINQILSLSQDLKARFKQELNIRQIEKVMAGILAYQDQFKHFMELTKQQAEYEDNMLEAARVAQKECEDARADQKAKMESQMTSAKSLIGLIIVAGILLGMGLAFVITRGITKPINLIISDLNDGSDQVASASAQVSSASQSLAEGASEQAAAIEETSSSLEEMSSMTKQNADNAGQANALMREATQVVGKANETMGELTKSMSQISQASEETSKIIKTIDEIAFQTNLLALNAAVEAARAGEAGAGFAVVADEVRNLAMRAAEAAKNTSGLIEETIKKVGNGSDLVAKTNEAFQEVSTSTGKVGELVGEIAAASQEQAQGIDQVNQAVTQMDKVTQGNAANAEESASAAEELNAQAENMRGAVGELVKVVMGAAANNNNHNSGVHRPALHSNIGHRAALPSTLKKKNKPSSVPATTSRQEVRAEEVIPMDEDFSEF